MNNQFKYMCRVCLLNDTSSFMCPLADQRTRELLFECTSVWVQPDDKLPQQLCAKCWNQCRSWSVFQTLAQDSDRQLRWQPQKEEAVEILENKTEEPMTVVSEGYSLEPEEEEAIDQQVIVDKIQQSGTDARTKFEMEMPENLNVNKRKPLKKQRQCRYCSETFQSLALLAVHRRIHLGEDSFPCSECDTIFKTKADLKYHESVDHAGSAIMIEAMQKNNIEKPFTCYLCGDRFTKKSSMGRHVLVQH